MSVGFNPSDRVSSTAAGAAPVVAPGPIPRGASPVSTLTSSNPGSTAPGFCERLCSLFQTAGSKILEWMRRAWSFLTCQERVENRVKTLEERVAEGGAIIDRHFAQHPTEGFDFRVFLCVMKYNNQTVACMRKVNESMGQVPIRLFAQYFLEQLLGSEANRNVQTGHLEIETTFLSRNMSNLINYANSHTTVSFPNGRQMANGGTRSEGLSQEECLQHHRILNIPTPEERQYLIDLVNNTLPEQ